ncbi:hypothetical protein QE152_g13996 [Popillia japonica]|uniref:Uncharacterized protein n=1 Tax=Popillia japonica TaxID=7064 RepID=A0AAW1L821_POPJA
MEDDIQKGPSDHNHGGDAANLETAKVMDCLRESVTTTQDTPQYLASSLSASISNGSVGQFPQLSSIERTIRNMRNAHDAVPALPQTRQDFVILEVYKLNTQRRELPPV